MFPDYYEVEVRSKYSVYVLMKLNAYSVRCYKNWFCFYSKLFGTEVLSPPSFEKQFNNSHGDIFNLQSLSHVINFNFGEHKKDKQISDLRQITRKPDSLD